MGGRVFEGAVVGKRIVLLAVAAVATTMSLSSCVRLVQENSSDDYTVNDRITSVQIDTDGGDVKVRSVDGATATTVKRTLRYNQAATKPNGPTHQVSGAALVLNGCGNGCEASYEVAVPSKETAVKGEVGSGDLEVQDLASVEVNLGSGNATLHGIAGAVRIENGSGDVTGSGIGGNVIGKVSSGNLTLSGVTGSVTVANSSGDIRAEKVDGDVSAEASSGNVVVELAKPHNVKANASSGDVTVTVPNAGYRVVVDTNSGDQKVDVRNDPSGQFELNLSAGSGNIVLKAA
jgi:putative adhesin